MEKQTAKSRKRRVEETVGKSTYWLERKYTGERHAIEIISSLIRAHG